MKPCTYEKHKLISFTSSNGTITSYLCCWFSRIKKNAFSLCPVWLASVASYRGWGIWGMASASTQSAQKEDCSFLKHVNSEYSIGLQGNHLSVFQFCDSCPETTYAIVWLILCPYILVGKGCRICRAGVICPELLCERRRVLWTRVVQAKLKANVGAMNPFIFGSWWFESLRKRLGIQEHLMM